jgi:hypothetical protein
MTRTVAFLTQYLYWSYWIMDQEQMIGIHIFVITFAESLPMNYTTSKSATYVEEASGNELHLC